MGIKQYLYKLVSYSLIVSLVATSNSLGFASSSTLSAPMTSAVSIPSVLAKIQSQKLFSQSFTSENPHIIHIQDAHGNAQGQRKVSELILRLSKERGVKIVFLEGAVETLDSSYLQLDQDPLLNENVLEHLVDLGEINAAELALLQDGNLRVIGIESIEQYRKNFNLFQEVMAIESQVVEWKEKQKLLLDKQASKLFRKKSLKLYRYFLNRPESESWASYVDLLYLMAEETLGLNLKEAKHQWKYPNLVRLYALQNQEQVLDLEQAKTEWNQITQLFLKQEMAQPWAHELQELLFSSDYDTRGSPVSSLRILLEQFYSRFKDRGFLFKDYPQLSALSRNRILQSEIFSEGLFDEVDRMANLLWEKIALSLEQSELILKTHQFHLTQDLLALELTPKRYETLVQTKAYSEFGVGEAISKALSFYKEVEKRDETFLRKIREYLKENNHSEAILVSGGFHTSGLSKLFERERISYSSIQPRISELKPSQYKESMVRGFRKSTLMKASWAQSDEAQVALMGQRVVSARQRLAFGTIETIKASSLGQKPAWFDIPLMLLDRKSGGVKPIQAKALDVFSKRELLDIIKIVGIKLFKDGEILGIYDWAAPASNSSKLSTSSFGVLLKMGALYGVIRYNNPADNGGKKFKLGQLYFKGPGTGERKSLLKRATEIQSFFGDSLGASKRVVIALGGNAFIMTEGPRAGKRDSESQYLNVKEALRGVVDLYRQGYKILLVHGNGPQVGDLLKHFEAEVASGRRDSLPPLYDIVDQTQENIFGYIQRAWKELSTELQISLPKLHLNKTHVIVREDDPAFSDPTKPVGEYYTRTQSERLRKVNFWDLKEQRLQDPKDPKKYRRVVPSPKPYSILESDLLDIREAVNDGKVVVAVGGGGIPVSVNELGDITKVEGVNDKDRSSQLLAHELDFSHLLIVTGVPKVTINFGSPEEEVLSRPLPKQLLKYLEEGQFPKGSMGPKVEEIVRFVQARPGRTGTIVDSSGLSQVFNEKLNLGTRVFSEDLSTQASSMGEEVPYFENPNKIGELLQIINRLSTVTVTLNDGSRKTGKLRAVVPGIEKGKRFLNSITVGDEVILGENIRMVEDNSRESQRINRSLGSSLGDVVAVVEVTNLIFDVEALAVWPEEIKGFVLADEKEIQFEDMLRYLNLKPQNYNNPKVLLVTQKFLEEQTQEELEDLIQNLSNKDKIIFMLDFDQKSPQLRRLWELAKAQGIVPLPYDDLWIQNQAVLELHSKSQREEVVLQKDKLSVSFDETVIGGKLDKAPLFSVLLLVSQLAASDREGVLRKLGLNQVGSSWIVGLGVLGVLAEIQEQIESYRQIAQAA